MNGCLCSASPKHNLISAFASDSSFELFCVNDNSVLSEKTDISWCTDIPTISNHCCPDLEYAIIGCRPFLCYLRHRPFCLATLCKMYHYIMYHGCRIFFRGDFNHADRKTSLPKYKQLTAFPEKR